MFDWGDVVIWAGFLLALAYVLVVSRKSMWVGLSLGAVVLGLVLLPPDEFLRVSLDTLTDLSILFLALGTGLIPIMGGALEEGGMMEALVKNLRIGKRPFLVFSPGLLGMLPIPGGALLSAPLVKMGGEGVSPRRKAAINVWYRHIFVMLYPLASILPVSKMAGMNVYVGVLLLVPGAILLLVLGYIFLLRGVKGRADYPGKINKRDLFMSLGVFLVAPMLHFGLSNIFTGIYTEFHMVFAVSVGLVLSFYVGGLGRGRILPITRKMKPWNYALIILGMFLFLNVFQASEAPDLIGRLAMPRAVFFVMVGALLGYVTGRLTAPLAIMIPIYFSKYGGDVVDPVSFALMWLAVMIGYVVSPIHPCLSVTIEYFKTTYAEAMKVMWLPAVITLFLAFVFALLFPF